MGKEHWIRDTIHNVIFSVPTGVQNYKGKKKYFSTGSIQDIGSLEEGDYTFKDRPSRANRIAQLNDVFQARMKNTNKPILIDKSLEGCLFSTGFLQLRSFADTYNSEFLYYYIQSSGFLTQKDDLTTGSTQEALTDTNAVNLELPLPPLNEQKRIVEKLDAILPKVIGVKKYLKRIPVILNKFRKSILISAYSGNSTSDWREKNSVLDSGSELLQKIIKTREIRKRTDHIDEQYIQLEVPSSWIITNIDSISDEVVDCPHSTPKWSKSGKICLRTTNFLTNRLNLDEKKFVSEEVYNDRISRLKPSFGDILYSREGGILGIACLLDINEDVCLGQRMMMFRVNENILNKYICYYLNSPIINNHVNMLISGSAAPHINVGDIKKYPVPLPPLLEQHEIVYHLKKIFTIADSLETRYKKVVDRVNKIEQSILAKAFQGKLVPQDPNDEPASVLLEKIKKEKKEYENKQKAKKQKSQSILSSYSNN